MSIEATPYKNPSDPISNSLRKRMCVSIDFVSVEIEVCEEDISCIK